MRLLIAGDTHGDRRQMDYLGQTALKQECDLIVQVGDFGYWPHMSDYHVYVNKVMAKIDKPFYWLDGNHENFDALEKAVDINADEPQEMDTNLWYLPRGSTWTWGAKKFMALGGAYSIDKDYRVPGRSWWAQEMITDAQVNKAVDKGKVDVLLTHDAPEGVCPIIRDNYKGDVMSAANRNAVSHVVQECKPEILYHGHFHHKYSAVYEPTGTKVIGLGRDGQREASWSIYEA